MKTKRILLWTLPALILVSLVCGVLAQEQKPTCAVLTFDRDENVDAGLPVQVCNKFSSLLAKTDKFAVLPRLQVNKSLSQKGFVREDYRSAVKAGVAAGKLLNVDYVAVGKVTLSAEGYSLEVSLVDVKAGTVAKAGSTKSVAEAKDLIERAPQSSVTFIAGISSAVASAPAEKLAAAKPTQRTVEKAAKKETPKPVPPVKTIVAKEPVKAVMPVEPAVKEEPVRPIPPPKTVVVKEQVKPVMPPEPVVEKEPAKSVVPPAKTIVAQEPIKAVMAVEPAVKEEPPMPVEPIVEKEPVKAVPPVELTVEKEPPMPVELAVEKEPVMPVEPVVEKEPAKPVLPVEVAVEKELAEAEAPQPAVVAAEEAPALEPEETRVAPTEPEVKPPVVAKEPLKEVTKMNLTEEKTLPAGTTSGLWGKTKEFTAGHLQVGTRITSFALMKDEKESYIGSINKLEDVQDHMPLKVFADWYFTRYFGIELSWDNIEAKAVAGEKEGMPSHSDGSFVAKGPIISAMGRFANSSKWTPYIGGGVALWSFGFHHTPWWHLGYGDNSEWVAAGSPSVSYNGLIRTIAPEDKVGLVALGGCSYAIGRGFLADAYVRYMSLDTEAHYYMSSGDILIDDRGMFPIPLDNIAAGIGITYAF